MSNNDIDKLFRAAKNGDEKTAAALAGEMKSSLSADKQQLLERALHDNDFLKSLLSSEKAKQIMDALKQKGDG